jgi:hypothetical protein
MDAIFAQLLKIIGSEWAVVRPHPEICIAILGVGLFLGWTFAWLVLKNRLIHHKELVATYEAVLSEKIPALKARTASAFSFGKMFFGIGVLLLLIIGPLYGLIYFNTHVHQRHLTESQKEELTKALKPFSEKVKTVAVLAETMEGGRYASDFADAMKAANITPFGPRVGFGAKSENDKGIMVGLVDPDHPSDDATEFLKALETAGLTPHRTQAIADLPLQGNDFDLFIGAPD